MPLLPSLKILFQMLVISINKFVRATGEQHKGATLKLLTQNSQKLLFGVKSTCW